MFHLINHAFFKALLVSFCGFFVIHAFSDEQDVRKMGGLLNILPITYLSYVSWEFSFGLVSLIYLVSILRDLLVEHAFVFWFCLGAFCIRFRSICCFFYCFIILIKQCFLFFYLFPRGKRVIYEKAHESAVYILLPLSYIGHIFNIFW